MTTIANTGRATVVATVIGLCLVGASRSAAEKHAPDVFARGHRTAPIPIALASGKVHLKMRIGDGEAVWFLLDTGANMTILDRSLAESLGLPLRGEMMAGGAAGGQGRYKVAFADVPSLGLPGLTIRGQTVAVIARRTQAANGHPSSGLLGSDVLARLIVEVDYPARTIAFHDPARFRNRVGGTVIPLTLNKVGKPLVDATLELADGTKLETTLLIDTGARGFVSLQRPFVDAHRLEPRLGPAPIGIVGHGVGGLVEHRVARLARLRIADQVIERPVVTFPPGAAEDASGHKGHGGVLGADFLTRYRVIFDYPGHRMILHSSGAGSTPPPADASGMFLEAEGAKFDIIRVVGVGAESAAADAGIAVGDRILALDGVDAAELGLDGVRAVLCTPGRHVVLDLDRHGERISRSLRLRSTP